MDAGAQRVSLEDVSAVWQGDSKTLETNRIPTRGGKGVKSMTQSLCGIHFAALNKDERGYRATEVQNMDF